MNLNSAWMQKKNIPLKNLLVICDDLALPLGRIRMRKKGSDGGHNGLKNINELLGTSNYCRLRLGIGDEFAKGHQVDYVLVKFSNEEEATLQDALTRAAEAVKLFVSAGADNAMNICNQKQG